MARKRVAYNDDGSILAQLGPGKTSQFVEEFLDWTTERIPIDIWALQSACPDVCYQRTRAGEILGQRLKPDERSEVSRGIDLLLRDGTDLLEIYERKLRPKGIKVLAEVRMSDTHHCRHDWNTEGCPVFGIEHPEYAIRRVDGIPEVALDYSCPEVREHRLAVMREFVEERNIDGLELNFMRWAKHFERDRGYEKAPIMTDFVGCVRATLDKAADKRGVDRLLLGARVPSTIHECFLAGCDVVAWVRRGYIDYIIPSEHNCTWPGLQVEQFVEAAGGTNCEVYAMMGDMIGGMWQGGPDVEDRGLARFPGRAGYSSMLNTPEEARAAAHNFYTWGAQGIGFWNVPNNCNTAYGKWGGIPGQVERMLTWIHEVIDPERVVRGTRRYHYVPIYKYRLDRERNYKYVESGRSPHGQFKGQTLYFNEGMIGRRQPFFFRMADGRNGERLHGKLRFRIVHCPDDDVLDADINGTLISANKLKRTASARTPEMPWSWFECNLADCPPFRGDNELGLTWRGSTGHGFKVPYMEELEVIVEV